MTTRPGSLCDGFGSGLTGAARRSSAPYGFSLLEVIVVVAIFAILAGAMAPLLIRSFEIDRETETTTEMRAILDGIFGRPDLNMPGYLSDMGALPCSPLPCALQSSTSPLPFINGVNSSSPPLALGTIHFTGMPYGFSPPYVTSTYPNPGLDAWGNPYKLFPVGTSGVTILSAGPDGNYGTADDIYLPGSGAAARVYQGEVSVNVLDVMAGGAQMLSSADVSSVRLFVPTPTGGTPIAYTLSWYPGSNGFVSSPNIPFGLRGVEVATSSTYVPCPSCVFHSTIQHNRQFTVANVYIRANSNPQLQVFGGQPASGTSVNVSPFTSASCQVVVGPGTWTGGGGGGGGGALRGYSYSASWYGPSTFRVFGTTTPGGSLSQVPYLAVCKQ